EKLITPVERFKIAIENSDEDTIKDITSIQSSLSGSDLIDRIYHNLIFICNSYNVYKSYDVVHNVQTIYVGVSLIGYILDQIVLKLCNNIEYKNDIGKELYKYAGAYNDLLFNLLYKLEVDFYVGDDEEE